MNWLASILVGFCAAILTAIITGTAADGWAKWLHVSTREGAAGYWVVMMALLGAVIALVFGISVARGWLLSSPNFLAALGTTLGVVVVVTFLITAIIWVMTDHAPRVDGNPIEIQAELRFPPGTDVEAARQANAYATIARDAEGDTSGYAHIDFKSAADIDGRVVLPITLELQTSAGKKHFNVVLTDGPSLFFPLRFGKEPEARDFEWSDWLAPARGEGAYALRYRARIIPPPPPPLTSEQQEALAVAQKEAELRALTPEAPLAQWLVFTRYGTPQPLIDTAIAAIRKRPDYVAAMTHEMLDGEHDASRDALRAIEHMQPPPAELTAGIAEVGRRIAQSLRELEREAPDTDEYNTHVADISTRFSAWMVATRALQEPEAADFTPQLQQILEPARRLDKAYAIRVDVVRVASFYLQKWAGIAPLPTDPPPR
jgi:hypothetical protein